MWDWKLKPTYHIGIIDFRINRMHNVPHDDSWLLWSALAVDGSKCIPSIPCTSSKSKFYSDALNIIVISLPDFQSQVMSLNTSLDKFIWLFSNLGVNTKDIPEWAITDSSFKRVLDTMESASLTSRESTTYHAELNLQKDINDEERYKQLENDVNIFMKAVSMLTDTQNAYDFAYEEFGPDLTLVLGERPSV